MAASGLTLLLACISACVTGGATAGSQPHIKTVFIILMENKNWLQIAGSGSAPYINKTLLPMASHAELYFNPPLVHPSLPNYLWLEAGTNFGILNDDPPSVNHQNTTAHLVTSLQRNNVSWKTYQENIDGADCPLVNNGLYAVRHNPFAYFDDVTNNLDANSANCISHVRPFGELATDLANATVAQYNFITPNVCNDMHDSCAPLNDPIRQGDTWLSQNLPTILNSRLTEAAARCSSRGTKGHFRTGRSA
jgi:phospholipase C